MKKSLILLVLILLMGAALIPLRMDGTPEARFHAGGSLRQQLKELKEPFYLDWYYSETSAVTAELELYLKALKRKGIILQTHLKNSEWFETRGYIPYNQNNSIQYSAVELEYLGQWYTIPLILDPVQLEERILAAAGYFLGAEKPVIALVNGDWQYPLQDNSKLMIDSLKAYGEPRVLKNLSELPDLSSGRGAELLILAGHRDLTLMDIELLKNYRRQGGAMLVLASPFESDPANRDQLLLKERSLFLQWMEEEGIVWDSSLLLEPRIGLPLSDGSLYPAWFPLTGNSAFLPLTQLWGSAVTADSSWDIKAGFYSSPEAQQGGQLGSLAPEDLQREIQSSRGNLYSSGLLLENQQGKLAVFGSRWIFSDLIIQTGSEANLESLNGLVMWLTDQESLLESREHWKKSMETQALPWFYFPLQMLIIPILWFILAWILPRRKRKGQLW